ncbi:outer membrane beta-barrel protein [Magnetovibrio sp. PR-2]|uniref:outer membrane protein n=1 Tax=Magnetovibrio sp. PR-2 TaxID=3120356 RepID=UPI002FCE31CD
MKKLAFSLFAFAAPFVLVSTGQAADLYAGVSVVGSSYNDPKIKNSFSGGSTVSHNSELDNGLGVLARFGSKYGSIRAEIELGYRDSSIGAVTGQSTLTGVSGDVGIYTAMLNGAYDFDMDSAFTPFVSAGFGGLYADGEINYTDTDGEASYEDGEAVTVAGQVGLGVSYELSPAVDLVGSYSLLGAPTSDLGVNQYLVIHNAQIGVNYNF